MIKRANYIKRIEIDKLYKACNTRTLPMSDFTGLISCRNSRLNAGAVFKKEFRR